ncbi:exopolysaccharide biosynthesis polyprenyl glycosylphosphotransferase [Streptococcus sp. zg-86]|uniref:Exopolysaccharide biosynthesis polyprenyl glycosylphosphotransferase n=1 Tax=Streptococcus zhangguiae TaxID=2664091 RepID=A0A6I4RIB4_9STRE|nr:MULTISPECIES: sugar transferase [unclassified Streptococcus]MTB65137.1 exopolysaccharide biosynthesis polyprenyl glycosylphosphotransferase [Streptococcus sp. zg-86]MTB91397.1 exopolysaccharide biosynthesis polyprenyl glycosylphosphotransferase [Streptococcus sp. zg-36]MWV57124.1 exopolysaccharide biosynthesis polyprenyl glycosylphosphotransferase [Streptococcus sp. zg-70]QTH47140.1 sugar transferase [Streptococcus sp. zg-86]
MSIDRRLQQLILFIVQLFIVLLVTVGVHVFLDANMSRNGIIILPLLHVIVSYICHYNDEIFRRGDFFEFIQTIQYSVLYTVMITFTSFVLKDNFDISRKGLLYLVVMNAISLHMLNTIIKRFYRKVYPKLQRSRKLLVLTIVERATETLDSLLASSNFYHDIVAVSTLDGEYTLPSKIALITKNELIPYVTKSIVDEIFINLPSSYPIQDYIAQFEAMGVSVSVALDSFDFSANDKKLGEIGDFNVVTFSTNFYKTSHILAKRILDIFGSLIGLFLCGVAYLFLAPKIKKDGGPVIFKQQRVGQNGRFFDFYKFRSMYRDAEERKKELLTQNTMTGGMFKMDNDPRITPIGRFMRRSSLDELPQFYNVLKGDMSLVGTRPPTRDEYDQYTPEQKRRLSFKPGITGLWQVSGRSKITDFNDVVKLDLQYIDGWTIWSDIKILLKTLKVVWKKDGAK